MLAPEANALLEMGCAAGNTDFVSAFLSVLAVSFGAATGGVGALATTTGAGTGGVGAGAMKEENE